MVKLISKLLLITSILATSSCSAKEKIEGFQPDIKFDNSLEQCISFDSHSISQEDNITLLKLKYHANQPIGHCGCKSALAQYRVFKPHQEVVAGLIDFRDKDSLNLTLTHVGSLLTGEAITISFSCSQPQ